MEYFTRNQGVHDNETQPRIHQAHSGVWLTILMLSSQHQQSRIYGGKTIMGTGHLSFASQEACFQLDIK